MTGRILAPVLAACTCITAGTASPAAREYRPNDWAAFVAELPPPFLMPSFALAQTPVLTLFRDGRVIWREPAPRTAHRTDPALWREGRVSPEEVARAANSLRDRGLFSIEESPQPSTSLHATYTVIGLSWKGQVRLVGSAGLDAWRQRGDASRLTRTLLDAHDTLGRLRPKDSRQHVPDVVRVELASSGLLAGPLPAVQEWPPFQESPPRPGDTRYYSGEQARVVSALLARSCRVSAGGDELCAWYAPAFDWLPLWRRMGAAREGSSTTPRELTSLRP